LMIAELPVLWIPALISALPRRRAQIASRADASACTAFLLVSNIYHPLSRDFWKVG
jgi:hypothetical protein